MKTVASRTETFRHAIQIRWWFYSTATSSFIARVCWHWLRVNHKLGRLDVGGGGGGGIADAADISYIKGDVCV